MLSASEVAYLTDEAVKEVCKSSATFVNFIRNLDDADNHFIRAIVSCQNGKIKVERVCARKLNLFGDLLKTNLTRLGRNTNHLSCVTCWLTITSSDEDTILNHTFFGVSPGESNLIDLDSAEVETEISKISAHSEELRLSNVSNLQKLAGRQREVEDAAVDLRTPSLDGRSQLLPYEFELLSDIEKQDYIARKKANLFFSLSPSLPRLQTSLRCVKATVDTSHQLVIPERQPKHKQEPLPLFEPSPFSHQLIDRPSRVSYSPQRSELWSLAERAMTRYTEFRGANDLHQDVSL